MNYGILDNIKHKIGKKIKNKIINKNIKLRAIEINFLIETEEV